MLVTRDRSAIAPLQRHERLTHLDVLRGFALLGILLVNVTDYAPAAASAADYSVEKAISVLAEGSFFPMFSMLFGVGFAVFLGRAEDQAGAAFAYLRRIAGLFAIALLQIVCLESRNILLRYAFLAIPLLMFWRASAKVCGAASVLAFGLAIAQGPIHRALLEWERATPTAEAQFKARQARNQVLAQQRRTAENIAAESRSFLRYVSFRARWLVRSQLAFSTDIRRNPTLFLILSMFLLGAAMWRSGVLSHPERHTPLLRRTALAGAVAGIAGNIFLSAGPQGNGPASMASWITTLAAISMTSNVALMLAYVAAVLLLCVGSSRLWQLISHPWASIGRIGLTNYLWQSVAMSVLFLPYGFRLDQRLPYWTMPLLALGIYLPCSPASTWWLSRFRFGPSEWLWRCLTYARLQPLRLSKADRS